VGKIEKRWRQGMSRREALAGLASFLAASPLLHAQRDPWPLGPHRRFLGFDEMRDVFDFEPIFRANVPLSVYDYTAHGTESEFTLYRNRDAFEWVQLIDRGGVDPKDVDTSKELFGHRMPSPIMLAPTARQRDLHPDGELGMHRAATTTGTTMIVSNASSLPFARIAQAAEGPLWFQRYATREMEPNRVALGGAQEVGSQTIVVTIDQQASFYERDLHDRHLGGTPRRVTRPTPQNPANPYRVGAGRLWYEWQLFDDLRPMCQVPMLAKGILTGEGAKKCVEHGCDGVIVSNHGGRAIDYGPSSLEVLEEVVEAVGGRVPVLIDSGFRRGSDALKALALGADAVCFGRASRWGLGAFGEEGAQRVLEILNAELKQAMAAAGVASLAKIDRSIVKTNFP
jgi:isopentenyl diphosphate isomerase/L-lactate dehydrogenase-like FMN-dependent dehydrogenase